MALRRLLVARDCLRAAVTVRSASTTTESTRTFENEKPVCPGNAFTLFLETQAREGKSLKKYIYEAACKWNKLSQEDKRIFQLQAKELEKKYKDEISKWETKMQQTGHGDVVQRHRQLTDGKNLAIERSWRATMDHAQESLVTTEENVSLVIEERKSGIKEPIKDGTEALLKGVVKEGKNTLLKETEKEKKSHTLTKETEKKKKLHTSMKETEKEEELQTSMKETEREEELPIEETVIRNLVQSSKSNTNSFGN